MFINLLKKLSLEFQKYNIKKIKGGASKKKFYRLNNDKNSFIVTDFSSNKKEYVDYLKIYHLLKNIDISIPKIIEKNDKDLIIISEDLGDLRFDRILNRYLIKDLLQYAVDTLIILKKSINFDKKLSISKYSFEIFKNEIIELPDYYFPYNNINNKNLIKEFMFIWTESFKKINFEFNNFTHKDFNINNLILIPYKKGHLKCGVIDYQDAFWGESSWDLFSLLEDSRILFTDKYNYEFIEYYHSQTNQNISLNDFKIKFHFLNSSRQTRLLGRWIKLSIELEEKWYLNYISVTLKRLKKSINMLNNNKLSSFYNRYIFK